MSEPTSLSTVIILIIILFAEEFATAKKKLMW